ncbi:MAG: DUF3379 family protein, partial [Gammaproteobacteria bacterium]|nr:DUF3379 family protein [Gammaproteobacteria bacterium]
MNCEQARLVIGAEPGGGSSDLEEHLRTCSACSRFQDEMRRLDDSIRRALQRPPEVGGRRTHAAPARWRQLALAASVLLAVLAGVGVWLLRPSDTLAREVVAHVAAEPDSWLAREHVDAQGIDAALRGSGVELGIVSDKVTYAQSCWFHGRYVPHLVVQTAHGPVTVMILRHEPVSARRTFHE